MDNVVHFEIPFDNLERAKKFYKIFGWQLEDFPGMDYTGVRTVEVDDNHIPKVVGAINGGMMKRTDQVKNPVIAIHVKSIDESVKNVVAAGGKVVMPKKPIGPMGFYAYVNDTEGNTIGLWESV